VSYLHSLGDLGITRRVLSPIFGEKDGHNEACLYLLLWENKVDNEACRYLRLWENEGETCPEESLPFFQFLIKKVDKCVSFCSSECVPRFPV